MCIGIPMQVESGAGRLAQCRSRGHLHSIDMALVGEQVPGVWVLTFLNAAREVLNPETAQQILQALQALEAVSQGETDLSAFFPDLYDRVPQLPLHLRPESDRSSSEQKE